MVSCKGVGNYIDLALFVTIAILISIIMQLTMYLIGAMACEMIGLQAENTFCQIYFSVDVVDPMTMTNISSSKRWCLFWRGGHNGARGIRCMRADSLLHLYKNRNAYSDRAAQNAAKKKSGTPSAEVLKAELAAQTIPEADPAKLRPLLPLIELRVKSLHPRIWINRNRQSVDLVMTLSIYKLADSDNRRLLRTLDTLFFNIPPPEQHTCLVMVFITEIFDDTYAENIISAMLVRYNVQIDTGLLEIVVPRDNFYTSMFKPKSSDRNKDFSEEKKRKHRYRRKQCMDHIYMMLLAYQRGTYYLQLSHNIGTHQDFLSSIHQAVAKRISQNWTVLRFSSAGIIGKLMHASDLLEIAKYMSRLDINKPADFHIENYVKDKFKDCQKGNSSSPTPTKCEGEDTRPSFQADAILFRYITSNISMHARSKDGDKKNAAKDDNSVWISPSFKSKNIEGYIPCTTIRFTNDLLPLLAPGTSLVGVRGKAARREMIGLNFNPPLQIYNLRVATGLPGTPRHSLGEDTTVWVFTEKHKMFIHIGNLSSRGDLETSLSPDLRKVRVLEMILGVKHQDQDIFLNELRVATSCRGSTRLSISSTAEVKASQAPLWYVPPRKQLPRREGQVLVSY